MRSHRGNSSVPTSIPGPLPERTLRKPLNVAQLLYAEELGVKLPRGVRRGQAAEILTRAGIDKLVRDREKRGRA